MSYTVGVKRKFWPGYTKYRVTAHGWSDARFILNLEDGAQLVIPGFHSEGIKVYPDFKNHIAVLDDARRKAENDAYRAAYAENLEIARKQAEYEAEASRHAAYQTPKKPNHIPAQQPWLGDLQERSAGREPDPLEERARRNAEQRVSSIFAGNGPSEGLADRPSIGGSVQ